MNLSYYQTPCQALEALTLRMTERMPADRPFYLALSGGETAKDLFEFWVEVWKDRIDWSRIRFFWVDERCVAPDDPQSNYGAAEQLLFRPLSIPAGHVFRIRGEDPPSGEATRYGKLVEHELPCENGTPRFDCAILGVGEDMHTASIFPDVLPLLRAHAGYAVSIRPTGGQMRVTMTGPLILGASRLLIPLLGDKKQAVVRKIADPESDGRTPAEYILSRARDAFVFTNTPEPKR